jgi:ankyrin repeat protein
VEEMERFLDKDYVVNVIDKERGWAPLNSAASFGRNAIAEPLIAQGADFNAMSNSGLTSLHIAVDQGNVSLVNLFIDKEADGNITNAARLTPLKLAENLFTMTKIDEDGKVVKILKKSR